MVIYVCILIEVTLVNVYTGGRVSDGLVMAIELSPLLRRCHDRTVAVLAEEFVGAFSRETVVRYVEQSFAQVGVRPTVGPNFLPVIVERFARERLWAVAQAEGRVEKALPEVLFVCEHNSGRSQMAAALAHHLSNGWVGVRSAGSHPDERIDSTVVDAMSELGVDVTLEFPKPLTDEVVRAADVVVTLGCGDARALYPGKRYLDWPVADPAGRSLEDVREIRYELYHHVWELLETLVPAAELLELHRPQRRAAMSPRGETTSTVRLNGGCARGRKARDRAREEDCQ